MKKVEKVASRLLGPVIFGQIFAEVVEFGLKAFGVDRTVTDIVFIASFLIMATILYVNKTVRIDVNIGSDYIVRVHGYGDTKPIQLKIYAENENEARLNAFHHMAIKYGADFIISSIEVVKE